MKPCFKRQVCAVIITNKGEISVGENTISNKEVEKCPRVKGENYDKCTSICKQRGHAETEAIRAGLKAGYDLRGAELYLIGHHRICEDCKVVCDVYNIKVIIVNKEGK